MSARVVLLTLPDGSVGAVASRPGYDALSEPIGSKGLSFDSRVAQLGSAWKIGTCLVNQAVAYPSIPTFQPLLVFARISGDALVLNDFYSVSSGGSTHVGYTWIGCCYSDHFMIVPMAPPAYAVPYDPSAAFAYVLLKGDA